MGGQESEGLIVPVKPANGPPRPEPVEGRGLPGQPTVVGKQGGHTEARSPVNARATDSSACGRKRRVALGNQGMRMVDRTSRMREFRTTGSARHDASIVTSQLRLSFASRQVSSTRFPLLTRIENLLADSGHFGCGRSALDIFAFCRHRDRSLRTEVEV